jgi:hypothetical protein
MSLQLVKTEWLTRLCLILKDETYFRQQYYIKEYSCSKRQFSSGYQSKHGYVWEIIKDVSWRK